MEQNIMHGPIPEAKLRIFKNIVREYSKLSKDPIKKVAAIILRPDLSIVSEGYNGFPSGFPDELAYWNDVEIKNSLVIHAEENALDYANSIYLEGHILICSHFPCPRCASKIIKRKIKHVYYFNERKNDKKHDLSKEVLDKAGVVTYFFT